MTAKLEKSTANIQYTDVHTHLEVAFEYLRLSDLLVFRKRAVSPVRPLRHAEQPRRHVSPELQGHTTLPPLKICISALSIN